MATRVAEALDAVERAQESKNAFGFLPYIHESLKEMQESINAGATKREAIAGALGRIVTDDMAFAESDLGGLLLDLANDFARGVGPKKRA